MYPADRLYTKDHVWIKEVSSGYLVGITTADINEDVIYVELPKIGATIDAGQSFVLVETTKDTTAYNLPFSGKVSKVNDALLETPETLNEDPYKDGWIVELTSSKKPIGLLSAKEYDG